MELKTNNPALIIIDFQTGFEETSYWGGNRNNPEAEKNAQKILKEWRLLHLPVFHIQHSSQNPDSKLHKSNPGFAIKKKVEPLDDEPIITKEVNSAFIGTDLKERLDRQGITALVILGLTTNHCVSTTARMASNFGYEVYLIADATASFDRKGIHGETYDAEVIHLTSLASLDREFVTVINTTDELIEQV